jgi:hypothetical protein
MGGWMRNLLGRRLFPVCPHLPCQHFWCRAKLVPKLAALGWRLLLHFARGAQKDTSWTLDITNGFQRENNGAKDDMLRVLAQAKYELCFALKVTTGSFFTSSLTKFTKGIIYLKILGIFIFTADFWIKFSKALHIVKIAFSNSFFQAFLCNNAFYAFCRKENRKQRQPFLI